MLTGVEVETGLVVIVKVALRAFGGIRTVEGTFPAETSLLCSETWAPVAGIGTDRLTVPCEGLPPGTVVGFSVSVIPFALIGPTDTPSNVDVAASCVSWLATARPTHTAFDILTLALSNSVQSVPSCE